MICKHILSVSYLNDHFLLTVEWFQVFLSNMNNSIDYKSFGCKQLNNTKYSYVSLIQLNIRHLFTLLNDHSSFVWTQFKYQLILLDQ